jgi:hypothetical protein
MKTLYTLFYFSLILSVELFSAGISSVWYFGKNAGLDFKNVNSEPSLLKDGQIDSYEGCAVISDTNGNLLFYTNGQFVWNKKHRLLNPNRIIGNPSSTMTAIVPVPENDSVYYALTVDYAGNYNLPRGFTCTHLNSNLINGDGGIEWQQDTIANEFLTEKIAVTKHANGRDYWIVLHEINNNNFRSYLLTPDGIDSNYVVSSAGSIHIFDENDRTDAIGYMKISQQGTKLALVKHENYNLELFDFDPSTGKVSNPKSFYIPEKDDEYTVYGVEFSPNGQKLYASIHKVFWVTDPDNPRQGFSYIYQWDLKNDNSDSIRNSKRLVVNYPNAEKDFGTFKAMQLAPDKKIYVARTDYNYLSVINNPDEEADSCGFELKGLYLEKAKSYSGMPNLISGMIFPLPKLNYLSTIFADDFNCSGEKIYREFIISNSGTKAVSFSFDSLKFKNPKFKIENIIGDSILNYRDSILMLVSYQPEMDSHGVFKDTFYLYHNDSIFIDKNPIPIEFVVELTKISAEYQDIEGNTLSDTLDLGFVTKNETINHSVFIRNLSEIELKIDKVDFNGDYYSIDLQDSLLQSNELSELKISFQADETGYYFAELFLFTDKCNNPADTLFLKCIVTDNYIIKSKEIDFGLISECDVKKDSVIFINMSGNEIEILNIYPKYSNDVFYSDSYSGVVSPRDSLTINIEYNPVMKGQKDSNILYIETDLKNNPVDSVIVKGETDVFNFEFPDTLNLGDVILGSEIPTQIDLINNGKLSRIIDSIVYKENITIDIDKTIINSNDTAMAEISVFADEPGIFSAPLEIIFNEPCRDTILIYIFANVIVLQLDYPDFIDFGKVSFCSEHFKSFSLTNNGNIVLQLDSIKLSKNIFFIDNYTLPKVVEPNDFFEITLYLDYENANDGFITDSLIVYYSFAGINQSLAIPVFAERYSLTTSLMVDSNPLETEISRANEVVVGIQNNSQNIIYIDSVNLPNEFLIKDNYKSVISSNETIELNLEYYPVDIGKRNYQIIISFSDSLCVLKDTIEINTKNYAEIFLKTIESIGDIGKAGFSIPFVAYHNYEGFILNDIEFEVEMVIPSDFFYFESISGNADLKSIDFVGKTQNISVSGSIDELSNTETGIFDINGLLLLNKEDSANVVFNNITRSDSIRIITENGLISNNGACAQSFAKLNLFENSALEIYSNSEIIRIDFVHFRDNIAELNVYNLAGISVYNQLLQLNNVNTIEIPNNLTSGIYYFVVKNKNGFLMQKHIIIR